MSAMNPFIVATAAAILIVVYTPYKARGFDRPLAAANGQFTWRAPTK